jgi:hypothetical protein
LSVKQGANVSPNISLPSQRDSLLGDLNDPLVGGSQEGNRDDVYSIPTEGQATPSPESEFRQALAAFFAQDNWQNLTSPELPPIQVVPADSLGALPAVFDDRSGTISVADTIVGQYSGQPTELANLVTDALIAAESLTPELPAPEAEAFEQPSVASTLESAYEQSQIYLKYLFSQSDWQDRVSPALGDSLDADRADEIAQGFINGNLTLQSLVDILPGEVLQDSDGVFDLDTQRIYLSEDFIAENAGNSAQVMNVLLEEFGHYLDAQLNVTDSEGDEGEIFAALAQGQTLTTSNLAAMQAKDDQLTLLIDGQEHLAEHSVSTPASSPAPDLVPITATTEHSEYLNFNQRYYGDFYVSWSVGNFGTQGTRPSWLDHIYASDDPYFDSKDVSIQVSRPGISDGFCMSVSA